MKIMKHNIILFLSVMLIGMMASCTEEPWGNNNSEMEHIYYYGLGNENFPGGNEKVYKVAEGEILAVPTYFFSAFERPYSPIVAYYTVPKATEQADGSIVEMKRGVDYEVVDKDGNVLWPDTDEGGFSMLWPNAKKGCQNVYIKPLNGKKGILRVQTYDPARIISTVDIASTIIAITTEYEVRAFSENYYVTVNIN